MLVALHPVGIALLAGTAGLKALAEFAPFAFTRLAMTSLALRRAVTEAGWVIDVLAIKGRTCAFLHLRSWQRDRPRWGAVSVAEAAAAALAHGAVGL